MIIVDTNIISELMRPLPNENVFNWMNSQRWSELGITAITKAEILYGIGLLPEGKKKRKLSEAAGQMFVNDFQGRIFPFDAKAADEYAKIVTKREKLGRSISMADAQIAAICCAGNFGLATRNTKDFENIEFLLINPFDPGT